ncbi:hypothetical protein B0H34DRAFT_209606 [Crassisporium funariophilum]|nr:hypothetical protein B0H34DRAFT_209606 [Crassisporium funariophilum]
MAHAWPMLSGLPIRVATGTLAISSHTASPSHLSTGRTLAPWPRPIARPSWPCHSPFRSSLGRPQPLGCCC